MKKRSKKLLDVGAHVAATRAPMNKRFLVLFFKKELLAFCFMWGFAQAATVHVTVSGVRNARGHVLVAICTKAEFLRPHCAWQGRAVAHEGQVAVDIAGVPPGIYAAQAFHDEDDNGRLERSFLGLPEEGLGFSRNAPMRFGPPAFADAAFQVSSDANIAITMHYY